MNIDELNDRFGIEGEIGFYEEEDLVFAMVSNKFADATISIYGAQILNFNPARNMEILWMSPYPLYQAGHRKFLPDRFLCTMLGLQF